MIYLESNILTNVIEFLEYLQIYINFDFTNYLQYILVSSQCQWVLHRWANTGLA